MGDRLSAERVAAVITQAHGNVSAAAAALGVSRQTIYRYIKRYATVAEALENARETMLDNVESVLYRKALEGEGWAVCFFLKTQGKKRGYVERQEVAEVEKVLVVDE